MSASLWQPPEMAAETRPKLPSAREIAEIERSAHTEGFELGRREGALEARAALAAVQRSLLEPLADLDEAFTGEVAELVVACTRQLLRREIKTSPGEVIGLVREALTALPSNARTVRLSLHPEDAELVRQALALDEAETRYRIVEDVTLSRGGCRVETEQSRIDATIEARIAAIAARVLGDERSAA